jgi:hypothetical protein
MGSVINGDSPFSWLGIRFKNPYMYNVSATAAVGTKQNAGQQIVPILKCTITEDIREVKAPRSLNVSSRWK